MKHFVHIFLLLSMCFCFQVQAQGLKTFKLKNGMSVFIWEDSGKSDVFGEVVVAERGLCFWKRYGVAAGVRGNVPL